MASLDSGEALADRFRAHLRHPETLGFGASV